MLGVQKWEWEGAYARLTGMTYSAIVGLGYCMVAANSGGKSENAAVSVEVITSILAAGFLVIGAFVEGVKYKGRKVEAQYAREASALEKRLEDA